MLTANNMINAAMLSLKLLQLIHQGKEKNRTVVEYALHDGRKPIGVATYEITKTLPKHLKGQLPPPEEIAALLEGIDP